MNRRSCLTGKPFLLFIFLFATPCPLMAQTALETLLQKVPADEQAGDRNVYSLTDIQAVLGASLSWNALLRRGILIEPESGLTFALVVESPLGRVGAEIVEWPEAPTQRRGEVYVSRGLLEVVFQRYPNFKLPGQEEMTPEPTPEEGMPTEEIPEEPPPAGMGGDKPIQNVLAILLPSRAVIAAGTGSSASPTALLVGELRKVLDTHGIKVTTVTWNPKSPEKSYVEADTLVALRVEAASPPLRTSFCYYDAPGSTPEGKGTKLYEWSRVSLNHKRDNRAIADLMYRNFVGVFGEKRSIGLRSAPIDILQGREIPAVLLTIGLAPAHIKDEAVKAAEVIGQSLAQLRKG
jgi:hypothetical protein